MLPQVTNKVIDQLELDAQDFAVSSQDELEANLNKLHRTFQKWLAIDEDLEALDVILAASLDRKIKGDPLWLFVVAVSGATKTEILRSIYNQKGMYLLSSLTSHTIVSGRVNPNSDMVKGLHGKMNGNVIVIPEFTQTLTKNREERDAIMGQLRDLYDGYCRFGFGTIDEPIEVKLNIGLIAACTPAIDLYTTTHIILGERFLKVRLKFDRAKALKRAGENTNDLEAMRQELSEAVRIFLDQLEVREIIPDEETLRKLGIYAEIVAHLRTVTSANPEYDSSEYMPSSEFGTRVHQQFIKLAKSLAVIRGHDRITEYDLATTLRVAFDTVPPTRLRIVMKLAEVDGFMSVVEIARATNMTRKKVETTLDHLAVIHTVEESDEANQYNETRYRLSDNIRTYFKQLSALIQSSSGITTS